MATKPDNKKLDDSEAVLERARENFKIAEEGWHDIYQAAKEDIEFVAGHQWPEAIKRRREQDAKPVITINKVINPVRQVTNDQRQNRPSIKVSPVDDKADLETAKVRQGLTRHIEYSSGADAAYDTAFEYAAKGGLGFWRITTDYCDPMSFDQDILIKRVANFESVLLDPRFQEPDGSDAEFGFFFDRLTKAEFKLKYPKAEISRHAEWGDFIKETDGWVDDSSVQVAEYYEKTFEETEIHQLSDGNVLTKEDLEEIVLSLGGLPPGVDVVASRSATIPKIKWYLLNGHEVLNSTDIPGQFIPIIPCLGAESYVDGKRILEGIVRHAKDSNRMYNYWSSSATETIALAPRAPFIGAEGQFEGHEAEWASANVANHAYLQYTPVDLNGQMAPPPQRQSYEPPVQAMTQALMLSSDDIKATTGLFDASLGNKSNETSGVAIQRRNMQSQTANFHLIDNLTRSIRHTGRIINAWIPVYYDGPRVARIIGEEGEEEVVRLNEEFKHKGEMKTFRTDVGKYDVTVETGPSFATKRQEAVESMLELTRAMPEHAANFLDLMVKNMDWPGAQEIAERLRKMLPPGLAEDKDKKPIPPEVQAQIQQAQQMVDQLTQALNEKQDELDQKTRELESKERIEFTRMQVDLQKKLAELEQKDSQLLLQTQVTQIQAMEQQMAKLQERLELVGVHSPIEQEQSFENEATPMGGEMPGMSMNQPPTGGFSPGTDMGV